MMKEYTIGEIHRGNLLLNSKGEPYKDKASVSNRLKGQPYKPKQTAHGMAKYYSEETIKDLNNQWDYIV